MRSADLNTIEDEVKTIMTKEELVNKMVEDLVGKPLKTPAGKDITIKVDNFGTFYIAFKTGGELPSVLQGKFTDYKNVAQAIRVYFETKEPTKEEKK